MSNHTDPIIDQPARDTVWLAPKGDAVDLDDLRAQRDDLDAELSVLERAIVEAPRGLDIPLKRTRGRILMARVALDETLAQAERDEQSASAT